MKVEQQQAEQIENEYNAMGCSLLVARPMLVIFIILSIVDCRVGIVVRHGVNTLRPRRNGRHFSDDVLKSIFFNENVWIPIEISLKFVPKGQIDNIPALV